MSHGRKEREGKVGGKEEGGGEGGRSEFWGEGGKITSFRSCQALPLRKIYCTEVEDFSLFPLLIHNPRDFRTIAVYKRLQIPCHFPSFRDQTLLAENFVSSNSIYCTGCDGMTKSRRIPPRSSSFSEVKASFRLSLGVGLGSSHD
jgi:hypothetical protein